MSIRIVQVATESQNFLKLPEPPWFFPEFFFGAELAYLLLVLPS